MMSQAFLLGNPFCLEKCEWSSLCESLRAKHEPIYLDILQKHGFSSLLLPIPLSKRYSKPRKWSQEEEEFIFTGWSRGKPITLLSAYLNRNPQDIIYKLLRKCKKVGLIFTQKNISLGSGNWTNKVYKCSEELFEAGLPAWKIAVIFQVDFEHVEKELFKKRNGYGHNKKNPFAINTEHKQLVNKQIIENCKINIRSALELFAGEGNFTKNILGLKNIKKIICIENDENTISVFRKKISDKRVQLICEDNLKYLLSSATETFDLIDVDPFVTCNEQLKFIWKHLNPNSLLFVTFGGEYRRSFIKTNRISIQKRYGFYDGTMDNKKYLEIVPYYFLGYVAGLAAGNGFSFTVLKSVRYANNCRFWLKITRDVQSVQWLERNTEKSKDCRCYIDHLIPRFREIRHEISNMNVEVTNVE